LVLLVEHAGELMPAERLIEALWPGLAVTTKALTNRIAELRRALDDDSDPPRVIETEPRRGDRLACRVDVQPPRSQVAASVSRRAMPAILAKDQLADQAWLHDALAAAQAGQRQLRLLGGEPGLGKTWLTGRFLATLPPAGLQVGRSQCGELASAPESFGPWLALLGDLAAGPAAADVLAQLRRWAPTWLLQDGEAALGGAVVARARRRARARRARRARRLLVPRRRRGGGPLRPSRRGSRRRRRARLPKEG
jgi:hypothetical protein